MAGTTRPWCIIAPHPLSVSVRKSTAFTNVAAGASVQRDHRLRVVVPQRPQRRKLPPHRLQIRHGNRHLEVHGIAVGVVGDEVDLLSVDVHHARIPVSEHELHEHDVLQDSVQVAVIVLYRDIPHAQVVDVELVRRLQVLQG